MVTRKTQVRKQARTTLMHTTTYIIHSVTAQKLEIKEMNKSVESTNPVVSTGYVP